MTERDICQELHQNFIDFAYEANSQRAFPDARDGLKPGQRACLWTFYKNGFLFNKPHVKSAKIAGSVIASIWPHNSDAVYETFVRMSQPWINNLPEVDWHGGNGNITIGPEAAASRYTEARLSKLAEDGFFQGIRSHNVKMIPNFSEDEEWPEVLPAIFPRLLVNGSMGIGVTIANTWALYNLREVTEVILHYIYTGKLEYDKLYPDFPTGGIIINQNDLKAIHETGKGKIILRGRTEINGNVISITELPYQVYIEPWIAEVKALVEKEEIVGIKDIINKTDKNHLLIEVICTDNPQKILSQLFSLTDLQKQINPNQYALVSKTPQLLTLKDYIHIYISHNVECLRKEFEFERGKALDKLEITEGLLKALEDIDNIIKLIKSSESATAAKSNLQQKYQFTERQAAAIVDMKLGKLAHLEAIELNNQHKELAAIVENCDLYLKDTSKLMDKVAERLAAFTKKYGTARKTTVTQITETKDKEIKNVVPEECVVVMTKAGTIKRIPSSNFKVQKRNGKGVKTQDDITIETLRTNTIDSLMIFSDKGKMYRLLVNEVPVGTNISKGVSIKTLVPMASNEKPVIIYSIYRDTKSEFVLFVTKKGMVKKTRLEEYIKTSKRTGIASISLYDGDGIAGVTLMNKEPIILVTEKGRYIYFESTEIPTSARTTKGVKGIKLDDDDNVIDVLPLRDKTDTLAIFAEGGLGKRIPIENLIKQKRSGRGPVCYKITSESGRIVSAVLLSDEDSVLISGNKSSICINSVDIPVSPSGTTVGAKMIKDSLITSVTKI